MSAWKSLPSSIQGLWREIERLQTLRLRDAERHSVWFVAKALAQLSGQKPSAVYRRILPKDEEQLQEVLSLHQRIEGLTIPQMLEEPFFCETFLNFPPTEYQLEFLRSQERQQSVLWSRQSGKSTTIGLKLFKFCILHPASQATITAPGFRQSKLVIEKTSDWLYKMNPVAYRAWIEKILRTQIRLRNRSRMKAFPYSLERLRGETSDIVDVEEIGFIPEAEELVQGTLMPQMATRWARGAQIIVNSTPWGRGYFWRIQNDPRVKPYWRHFFATWRDAVEAGLTTEEFIKSQWQQLDHDRFEREYECRFTEDSGRWLSQDLITSCVDSSILGPWRFEDTFQGLEFYMGIDVGQVQDYSVLAVVEEVGGNRILRHVNVFDLGTKYDVVQGYAKVLSERWRETIRILVDATNERALAESMRREIRHCEVEGVALSLQAKMRYAGFLKQLMSKKQFKIYFDSDIIGGLTVEQFKQAPGKAPEGDTEGYIIFSHPPGTHDDIFWAICLACGASMPEEETKPYLAMVPR